MSGRVDSPPCGTSRSPPSNSGFDRNYPFGPSSNCRPGESLGLEPGIDGRQDEERPIADVHEREGLVRLIGETGPLLFVKSAKDVAFLCRREPAGRQAKRLRHAGRGVGLGEEIFRQDASRLDELRVVQRHRLANVHVTRQTASDRIIQEDERQVNKWSQRTIEQPVLTASYSEPAFCERSRDSGRAIGRRPSGYLEGGASILRARGVPRI
jgi:hypothetical protein